MYRPALTLWSRALRPAEWSLVGSSISNARRFSHTSQNEAEPAGKHTHARARTDGDAVRQQQRYKVTVTRKRSWFKCAVSILLLNKKIGKYTFSLFIISEILKMTFKYWLILRKSIFELYLCSKNPCFHCYMKQYRIPPPPKKGCTLSWWSTLDILLTISNFITT